MREIQLTQGKVALVDDEDYFPLIRLGLWSAQYNPNSNTWYARNTRHGYMPRVILGVPKEVLIDHRDHDGLNNQRYNIREATYNLNSLNMRKKTTGIFFCKYTEKYRVRVARVSYGYYPTFEEALVVRNSVHTQLGVINA